MAKVILGIDEVGRGPWAGPLVVGAVILGTGNEELWQGLTDSKQLTAKKREEYNTQILEKAAATGLGWVSSEELDRYGLSASLKLATRRAVKQTLAHQVPFDEIVIDGISNFLINTPLADQVTTLKKADALVKEVSAASIIAKVARDRYMTDLAQTYPGYGFEKHVGYGTAAHRQALAELGVCPEHRKSFRPIQAILAANNLGTTINPSPGSGQTTGDDSNLSDDLASPTARGQRAEQAVARYLVEQGHLVVAHNFKTATYEIDLISVQKRQIFFTEVKYSRNTAQTGTPLNRLTPAKLQQMRFAAQSFLQSHPVYQQHQPFLAAASVTSTDFRVEDWLILPE